MIWAILTVNLNGLKYAFYKQELYFIYLLTLRHMVLTLGEVSDFLSAETITQEKSEITQELAPSFKHGSNCP